MNPPPPGELIEIAFAMGIVSPDRHRWEYVGVLPPGNERAKACCNRHAPGVVLDWSRQLIDHSSDELELIAANDFRTTWPAPPLTRSAVFLMVELLNVRVPTIGCTWIEFYIGQCGQCGTIAWASTPARCG